MPIQVICSGCHARFKVSDQFAGKKGPCPKCKAVIQIPEKMEEVKVHAPETFGPKGTTGKAVLQPIFREDVSISIPLLVGIGIGSLAVLIGAFVLRQGLEPGVAPPTWLTGLMAIGAVLLAPPAVYAGYAALRDPELGAHSGRSLWMRIGICSLLYAGIWGAFALLKWYLFNNADLTTYQLLFVAPPFVLLGGGAALVTLDFDYLIGLVHFGFYLLITVLLRVILLGPVF
ncbi:hypothetical protein [Lignipirellula cremea]|uniref:Uncharacterized protein n=1 Tax=Lignipirellula cremea TaxID=2528010 RepID=A0A518E239_9BACT|nr:hypothetical protein [Lignipirellula cremea]QDU98158.1 hypothetical protein Pla8534_60190 [Lignipirellula cremea]